MQTDLREARQRAGMTLQELAALSGVDYSTISRLERGKQAPSYQTAQALSAALRHKLGTLSFPKLDGTAAQRSALTRRTVSANREEEAV